MARGWESKSIEGQQEEAQRRADTSAREPRATDPRRTLVLARAHTLERLRLARTEAQRQALQQVLADLDQQLNR